MGKRVVFLTGEQIGANSAESLHLYKRIVSFKKSSEVAVITQSAESYAEKAGCQLVVHLTPDYDSQNLATELARHADLFVIVGMSPNVDPSASLLYETTPDCNIAIINKGNMELPKNLHREHVVKMRDMGIGTGLMFLSVYRWLKDLAEE